MGRKGSPKEVEIEYTIIKKRDKKETRIEGLNEEKWDNGVKDGIQGGTTNTKGLLKIYVEICYHRSHE